MRWIWKLMDQNGPFIKKYKDQIRHFESTYTKIDKSWKYVN